MKLFVTEEGKKIAVLTRLGDITAHGSSEIRMLGKGVDIVDEGNHTLNYLQQLGNLVRTGRQKGNHCISRTVNGPVIWPPHLEGDRQAI